MSHLQFYRAILSRNFIVQQNRKCDMPCRRLQLCRIRMSSAVALHCCKVHSTINRKMENSTPCKIVTPENFILKLGTRDYVENITSPIKQIFMYIASVGACPQIYMYLICQMQTDNATTKQHSQWQDSKAQHALTTALDKKFFK